MDIFDILSKAKELGFSKLNALKFLAQNMPEDIVDRVNLLSAIMQEADLQGRMAQQEVQRIMMRAMIS